MKKNKTCSDELRLSESSEILDNEWIQGLRCLPGAWLFVHGKEGVVAAASKQLGELLGIGIESLLDRPMADFSQPTGDLDWNFKRFDLEMLKLPGRYEDVALKRSDGSIVTVDIQVSHPPHMGNQPVAVCLFTDRTEQRRLADELISKHQELRRAFSDLEKRSDELLVTKDTLENRNRELGILSAKLNRTSELAAIGEITAELTHQLNNPLAAAIGAARRLDTLIGREDVPTSEPMLKLLSDSLTRLKTTITDLKRVYVTSHPLDIPQSEFDLNRQIDGVLNLMQQSLEPHQLILELPPHLPRILGRPSQIQHVIINLLDNAIRSIGKSGVIHIKAEHRDEKILMIVGDSGPGVPEHLMDKIFEPFFTTSGQGSGLGLAVVRRNLDRDNANIRVGRSEYGGALFEVEFQSISKRKEITWQPTENQFS